MKGTNAMNSFFNQDFYAYKQHMRTNKEFRNRLGKCPICEQNIKDRHITLYKGLINALYLVYCYLGEKRKHEFYTKDIKHLLGKNEYARFGDLVRFGGIIYKPKGNDGAEKAWFGMNMARAREFFAGFREIPIQITLNQLTGEIEDAKYVKVSDFPELYTMLNEKGLYDYEMRF